MKIDLLIHTLVLVLAILIFDFVFIFTYLNFPNTMGLSSFGIISSIGAISCLIILLTIEIPKGVEK